MASRVDLLIEQNVFLTGQVAELRELVELQKTRIEELERQLKLRSSNSDKPPSLDPPWAERKAKGKADAKKKRRRRRPGTSRRLVAIEEVDKVVPLFPERCSDCDCELSADSTEKPQRHQVVELPTGAAEITEYQCAMVSCPRCHKTNRADLPEGVGWSAFGPRLTATVSMLTGGYRLSKRQVQTLLKSLWKVDISLGSITRCESRMSDALDRSYEEACSHVQQAEAVYADETPWKERHVLSWLWTASSEDLVTFRIQPRRTRQCAEALLGETFSGMLVSDRYGAYLFVPMHRRQACWSHLKREMVALCEFTRDPVAHHVGGKVLSLVHEMFSLWHEVQRGHLEPRVFRERMYVLSARIETLLEMGVQATHPWTRSKCRSILKYREALWRFVEHDGIEPTNNRAERALRHGVLYRKVSLGTQSSKGSRFVERMLTTWHTLRVQGRDLYDFLVRTAQGSLTGQPPPSLLPAPA